MHKILEVIGFSKLNNKLLKTKHLYKDDVNLRQKVYQIFVGYHSDDDSDELTDGPVLKAMLTKENLLSS
jgi:hypothetical protein